MEQEIESYDFKSFEEIFEEIQCIKCSNEYVQEAGKDPNHFLRVQVAEMERQAPRLKRYERVQANLRKIEKELGEIQHFYRATCEDMGRLKIKERYLLNQSIDSFGAVGIAQNTDDLCADVS